MAEGNRLPSLENAPHLKTDGEFFRISTLQRHHYITNSFTYQFSKNVIFCSSLQYRFSKITPSFFVDKASCTRQFESEFSLHSLASLFPIKEGVFSKTYPSFLTVKEGVLLKSSRPSLPLKKAPPLTPSPLSSGAREKTALLGARNRYAIRLADHQRPSPCYAGWDRQRNTSIYMEESCIQFSFYIIAIP